MNMGRGLLQPYGEAVDRGRYQEVAGRAAFDIGSLFVGAGEARGAAEVGNVTRGIEGAETAARIAESTEGLRGTAAASSYADRAPVRPPPAPTTSLVPIDTSITEEITEVTRRPTGDAAQIGDALGGAPPAPTAAPAPTASPVPTDFSDEITEVLERPRGEATQVNTIPDHVVSPDATTSIIDKVQEAFKDLIGGTKRADAPAEVQLPKKLNEGMQDAWGKSFPGGKGQEHGGIVVQDATGDLNWKAAPADAGNNEAIHVNWNDVEPGESWLDQATRTPMIMAT